MGREVVLHRAPVRARRWQHRRAAHRALRAADQVRASPHRRRSGRCRSSERGLAAHARRDRQMDRGRALKRADKAVRIGAILDELYPEPPIPLAHRDPFTLLVAVALSAQTTDVRVNKVTPGLFARAATPEAMARLSEDEILALIRSCGLAPGKAKNLKRLAQTLVDRYGGHVPRDMAALETLPGVGHKTANVVMTQSFAEP